jgi:nucleotide-binding universal stress UspA family protein
MLGSVTAKISGKTSSPILAIPEQSKFKGIDGLKNVLFATDFDDADHLSLSKLINLLHPFDVALYCVHIAIGTKKPWQKVKMENLKETIQGAFKNVSVNHDIVVSDDIVNGLEMYMRNHDIDAIALTSQEKGLLARFFTPSITKILLGRVNKPLLIFNPAK